MEINIGISECDKNVDNYYGRNIGSHTNWILKDIDENSPDHKVLALLPHGDATFTLTQLSPRERPLVCSCDWRYSFKVIASSSSCSMNHRISGYNN